MSRRSCPWVGVWGRRSRPWFLAEVQAGLIRTRCQHKLPCTRKAPLHSGPQRSPPITPKQKDSTNRSRGCRCKAWCGRGAAADKIPRDKLSALVRALPELLAPCAMGMWATDGMPIESGARAVQVLNRAGMSECTCHEERTPAPEHHRTTICVTWFVSVLRGKKWKWRGGDATHLWLPQCGCPGRNRTTLSATPECIERGRWSHHGAARGVASSAKTVMDKPMGATL